MSVETYWRSGYTVKGATDVVVERYGRSEKFAMQAAESEVREAVHHLQVLGLASEVEIWTEKWKSVTTVTSEARVCHKIVPVERRREVRELSREERAEATAK